MTDAAEPLQNPPDEPKVILAAVDSSAGALRVLGMASRMARAMPSATLHLVHVFRTSRLDHARAGVPASSADVVDDAKEYLQYHVSTARKQCRAEVVGHFVLGDPVAEILKLAKELGADVLVIGTHDVNGFERLLLGSVAETLVRKAGCSTVVVRDRNHER